MVANNVVFQLKKLDRHIPALAIASAISERLTDLRQNGRILEAVNASGNSQRYLMYSEATRRQTFLQWPHMDYKWVLLQVSKNSPSSSHLPASKNLNFKKIFSDGHFRIKWHRLDFTISRWMLVTIVQCVSPATYAWCVGRKPTNHGANTNVIRRPVHLWKASIHKMFHWQ